MTAATSLLPDLTGSFSSPASGNPTGAMVEAAYGHHGINARYVNCEVTPDALADAVAGARAMGWIGFNCSLPHKQAIIPLLDELAPSAETIGAVNCVVNRSGRLIGENTDGRGFVSALREIGDPVGKAVTILGAGGAARAIAVELALAGAAALHIVNRDAARAEELGRVLADLNRCEVTVEEWAGNAQVSPSTSILVNATSLGLAPDVDSAPAVDWDAVRDGLIVCDVIPNPAHTRFLRRAEQQGAITLDGRGMLTNQAAINVRLWTGIDPDTAVMRGRLDEAIEGWRHPVAGGC